jgi:hypothetical protein
MAGSTVDITSYGKPSVLGLLLPSLLGLYFSRGPLVEWFGFFDISRGLCAFLVLLVFFLT